MTSNPSKPTIRQHFSTTPLRRSKLHFLRRREHQNDQTFWLDDEIITSFLIILPIILPAALLHIILLLYCGKHNRSNNAPREITCNAQGANSNAFLSLYIRERHANLARCTSRRVLVRSSKNGFSLHPSGATPQTLPHSSFSPYKLCDTGFWRPSNLAAPVVMY